jgi:hypothetical protein
MAANVYGQLTNLDAVKVFGPYGNEDNDIDIQKGASKIALQAETQNVRYRTDGTDPTANVGMILVAGAAPTVLDIKSITNLKVIEAAASAKLNYHFYA